MEVDFLAALVAICLRGAFPPVDLRAVCFVRAIEDGVVGWWLRNKASGGGGLECLKKVNHAEYFLIRK